MANKTEVTVEEKLRALYDLQLIDSRIDEIRNVRGELPLEVEDLEDEIAGLNTRLDRLKGEIEELNEGIASKKNVIEEAKVLIKRYSEQQKNVRNKTLICKKTVGYFHVACSGRKRIPFFYKNIGKRNTFLKKVIFNPPSVNKGVFMHAQIMKLS